MQTFSFLYSLFGGYIFRSEIGCPSLHKLKFENLFDSTVMQHGPVRLNHRGYVGGSSGRVEVWNGAEWGTVCDNGLIGDRWFDQTIETITEGGRTAARVICKSLGYNDGEPIVTPEDNRGTGKILMTEVRCNGDEESLFTCKFIWFEDCHHYEDFSVSCS